MKACAFPNKNAACINRTPLALFRHANSGLFYPKTIFMGLRVKWGLSSAHQLTRVSAGSDKGTMAPANYVDEASDRCGISRAFGKARKFRLRHMASVSL